MTLAQAMKQRRLELRKTAVECATLANMTTSEWSRWETGVSRRKNGQPSEPRTETLREIASALELTPQELRERAAIDTKTPDVPVELAFIWRCVPTENKNKFLHAVRSIAEAISYDWCDNIPHPE